MFVIFVWSIICIAYFISLQTKYALQYVEPNVCTILYTCHREAYRKVQIYNLHLTLQFGVFFPMFTTDPV